MPTSRDKLQPGQATLTHPSKDRVPPTPASSGTGAGPDSNIDRETGPDSIHTVKTNLWRTNHISTVPSGPDIEHHATLRDDAQADASADPSSDQDTDDAIYDRFPRHRKVLMAALLSFCSFLSPISSTSVLAATPEVAAEYATDGTVINMVNAVYMLAMGVSPVVWGPMSQVYGWRPVGLLSLIPSNKKMK